MVMKNHMIFIYIPQGKFPKTRAQLAKDSGISSITNLKLPVFYADKDSRIAFTDINLATVYANRKGKFPSFVEAGK